MYNAELVERRSPGERLEPAGYPSKLADIVHNAVAMKTLLEAATRQSTFLMSSRRTFEAFYGVVPQGELLSVLRQLRWMPEDHFAADLRWLEGLSSSQINDWVIVLPQLAGDSATRSLFGMPRSIHERSRREGRVLFSGIADPKHRLCADRLAGNAGAGDDLEAGKLQASLRGAVLIYPVFDTTGGRTLPTAVDAQQLIMGLVIASPQSTGSPDEPLVRFRAIDPTRASQAIIDA